MSRVVFSQRAKSDIERMHRFLVARDPRAARRGILTVKDAFVALRAAPMMGRPVADKPELRELIIGFGAAGYLALYRIDEPTHTIVVLAIKHQKENDYR